MSLATIRSKIKTRMEAVTNIGVVNDFEPRADRDEVFRTYFKHASLAYILGWSITRERTDERDLTPGSNFAEHLIVIRGYRAIATGGSTEKDFQDLIESVRDKLRIDQRLQLDGEATLVGPPSVRVVEPRAFGEFLVHYCEITLAVTEEVAVG